jgi:hypothetical protein
MAEEQCPASHPHPVGPVFSYIGRASAKPEVHIAESSGRTAIKA